MGLSEAYDINPGSGTHGLLQLNINEDDKTADYEIALSCADQFGLKSNEARLILNDIYNALHQWHTQAKQYGLSKNEIDQMEYAFKIDELTRYRSKPIMVEK